jgi:hypothetical protein
MKDKVNNPNLSWLSVKLLSLLGTIFLTLVACDNSSNTPPPSGDTTSPSIVSITPNNGAIGVTNDSTIVISFSEAMDKTRTEQAFGSTTLPGFGFSWNADGTVLTVVPSSDLIYTFGGNVYSFSFSAGATDLAGNALQGAPVGSSFTTLRQITLSFESVASEDGTVRDDGFINPGITCNAETICVGDSSVGPDASFMGFLSFDLSSLPEDLTQLVAANLRVYQHGTYQDSAPYTDLGPLLWDHVFYDVLDVDDTTIPALTSSGQVLSANASNGYKTTEVTSAVQDDWAKREERGRRSQYRLRFTEETDDDGIADIALFSPGEGLSNRPRLSVTFLIPKSDITGDVLTSEKTQ